MSDPIIADFNLNISVAADADVVSLHEDAGWGVPWDFFMNGSTPPARWQRHIENIDTGLKVGGPWVAKHGSLLSLQMVGGSQRSCPSRNETTKGSAGFTGCTACYDFNSSTNPEAASVKVAYIKYVLYMVAHVGTQRGLYVNYATELNMYYYNCTMPQWYAVVDFANQVYSELKAAHPSVVAFPSFQVEFIKGQGHEGDACWRADSAPCEAHNMAILESVHKDVFAMSTYPWSKVSRLDYACTLVGLSAVD
jgi:hypothetical protein